MKFSHASIDPQGQNLLVHLSQPGKPDVVINIGINESDLEVSIANKPEDIQVKIINPPARPDLYVPNWRPHIFRTR